MDTTPLIHAAIAVAVQAFFGVCTGNWWLGGALACIWWIAREHTQAEYRWIERFGGGVRARMPQWGGFDPRVWTLGSVVDWLVPVIVCAAAFLLINPG